jgi:site-specific recombinase XerD
VSVTEKHHTSIASIDLSGFKRHLATADISTATASAYLGDVQMLLDWLQEGQDHSPTLDELSEADIAAFLDDLQEVGYGRGTVNRRLAAIKRFSTWLTSAGIVERDIAANVEYIPQDEDVAASRVPSDLQIKRLLDACGRCRHPKRSKAALLLMLHAGLNVEEVVALTLADLELSSKRSHIVVCREGQVLRIPIPRAVRRAIEAYRMEERGDDISDHVFVSQKGGQLAAVSLRQSLARCFKAAGLARYPLGSLRGVFARYYLAAHPADLAGLVRLLRVNDWNTLKHYFYLEAA